MKLPHHFGTKQGTLSTGFLDDNFEYLAKYIQGLEDRLNAQGTFVAEQNTVILQMDARLKELGDVSTIRDRVIAKLAEKPTKKAKA